MQESAFVYSFPGGPDFRTIADGGLLAVSYNRCFHQTWIIKHFIFLGSGIIHVFHVGDFLGFAVPVDEIINSADCPEYAVELLAGHSKTNQVDGLIFNAAFFEIAFGFLRIKALALSENLNIQYSTPKRQSPCAGARNPAS